MQGNEENKVSWATCSASCVHVFLQAQCSALFISSYQALKTKSIDYQNCPFITDIDTRNERSFMQTSCV